ncbi:MAG TPA: hypothetical protein V6C98_00955 [Thermosynechococcaceae cyanobacterium]|jgi:hypothetical protein
MTTEEFKQYWQKHYPECPPIAHYLKFDCNHRWLRIHTLPQSKRYAETQEEYQEILKRHNALLTELLGKNDRYLLITVGYSKTVIPVRPEKELGRLVATNRHLLSLAIHKLEGEGDPNYRHLYINERVWIEHSMDDLLKMVADDEIANVMFIGVEQKCLYHPYDGGADIVLESEAARDILKKRYSAWLSNHPEGL